MAFSHIACGCTGKRQVAHGTLFTYAGIWGALHLCLIVCLCVFEGHRAPTRPLCTKLVVYVCGIHPMHVGEVGYGTMAGNACCEGLAEASHGGFCFSWHVS